jgi:hypothetical protein
MDSLKKLSDRELLNRLTKLVHDEKQLTINILPHLVEVERRELYARKAYASLYEYCKGEFGYSDASAWRRANAALAIYKCPEAFDLLQQGRVSITALAKIHDIIIPDMLREICDKSLAQVDLIAAVYNPKKAVRDRTRQVAVPKAKDIELEAVRRARDGANLDGAASGTAFDYSDDSDSLRSEVSLTNIKFELESKWKIEGLVSDEVMEKIERCKSLLSTKHPEGVDYNTLFDELTEVFLDKRDPERRIERREKRQEKQRENGQSPKKDKPSPENSRHIPIEIKDTVWNRDKGRCAFVGANGRRCDSTHNLQFDHYPIPYARGGPSTDNNLRLLCATHNRYTAKQTYGEQHMQKFYLKEDCVRSIYSARAVVEHYQTPEAAGAPVFGAVRIKQIRPTRRAYPRRFYFRIGHAGS